MYLRSLISIDRVPIMLLIPKPNPLPPTLYDSIKTPSYGLEISQ